MIKLVSSLSERFGYISKEGNNLVLFGMQIILPNISSSVALLEYPNLSKKYYFLLSQLSCNPDIAALLPPTHFQSFLHSITYGLEFYQEDATFSSFECLKLLLNHLTFSSDSPLSRHFPPTVIQDLLKLLFQLMIYKELRSDCFEIAATCLLSAIVLNKQYYQQLVSFIINSNPSESDKISTYFTQLTDSVVFEGRDYLSIENVLKFQANTRLFLLRIRPIMRSSPLK